MSGCHPQDTASISLPLQHTERAALSAERIAQTYPLLSVGRQRFADQNGLWVYDQVPCVHGTRFSSVPDRHVGLQPDGLAGWDLHQQKGSAGAVSSLPQKLCSQGKKRLFTFRDTSDDQTHQATQQQGASLGFPPPKPLQQEDTTNTGWDFHCSKGKLCQVDVQTKISHVQTQTVVDDAVNEPENRAEWQQSHLLAMRKYSSDLH